MKVSVGSKSFVIKELSNMSATDVERKLFRKGNQLLRSLDGCENVVKLLGFFVREPAMLQFQSLAIDHELVYNLKEFLTACDMLSDDR
jgi:hypothetical protein